MWTRLALVVLGLGLVGCGDDGNNAGPNDASTHNEMGTYDGPQADGGGCPFSSPHEQLLNAPTTADTVHKTPTHPPVGDGGLP